MTGPCEEGLAGGVVKVGRAIHLARADAPGTHPGTALCPTSRAAERPLFDVPLRQAVHECGLR
jgi:hypothetical protein